MHVTCLLDDELVLEMESSRGGAHDDHFMVLELVLHRQSGVFNTDIVMAFRSQHIHVGPQHSPATDA